MTPLTWRALLQPEYITAFIEGFLTVFLPTGGFGHVATTNGAGIAAALTTFPSEVVLFASGGFGLLGGIRAIRNLRAIPPTEEIKKP